MAFTPSQSQITELEERGIVIIDDYLSAERCNALKKDIDELLERDSVAWETGSVGYSELAGRGEVVVNERAGENDDGMLDIFNIDLEIQAVEDVKTDSGINELINEAASEPFSPDNINVYYNKEVTDTRDFHADTYGGKFKAFVYLTDVPDKSYGPFSYIPGTHKTSTVKQKSTSLLNKVKGDPSTDAVFYDEDEAIYCTAPKGTLIVANQAGYHRGTPQEKGHTRVLVNTSYTPDN
ncbi:phytanoyl-CoA dioxygenase family protein [Halorubrum halophilum]|uniref:phytanoyl-CoA dioxygenase family protein n=1 Tax=Halorubrum halophilum TaxID=413816 RepID=UPI000679221D|nr:phytanoyl-CoA dioxygenase family protein [Halorubrum halophilum]